MRGADGVRDKLAELFAQELPRKIPLIREARAWGAELLPDVDRIVSGNVEDETIKTAGVKWRTWVVVVNPRLVRMTPTGDFSPTGEPEFHSLYSCRVIVWHLGDDWHLAIAGRDHVAEAARACLVQYPTLSTEPGDSGYRLNVPTYTEDFGTPARANNSNTKTWAAAILTVEVLVEEHLDDGSTLPALGAVQTVEPESYASGFDQPMKGE
jgi:hypothetical protein